MSHFEIKKRTLTISESKIGAYEARPAADEKVKAGLVLIQEIFGVNRNIKSICDDYAKQGFWVVAPALFDHVTPNLELGYSDAELQRGIKLMTDIGFATFFADAKNTGAQLQQMMSSLPGKPRKVGVVGYCLGGSLCWALSGQTQGIFSAASGYYGSQVSKQLELKPHNPIILHFGENDHGIPMEDVAKVKKAHPEVPVYVYGNADHGFSNQDKKTYNADAATLAEKRTVEFFQKNLF